MFSLFLSSGPSAPVIILIIVAIFLLIVAVSGFKIVSQANAYVIESFVRYHKTWGPGIH